MHVTGNPNANPSSFNGSSEDIPSTPIQLKLIQQLSADCSGSIHPGESKTCNVVNEYQQQQYVFIRKWGSHGNGDGLFEEPTGIAIDSSNNVYVSDMDFENCCNPNHHRVQKFNSNGGFLTKWGGNGQFINPMGIAIDSTGKVYVADQVHQLIKKFTNDGTFVTSWSSGVNPTDIAIDSADNIYVTEMFDSRIAKFTSDGNLIKRWNTAPIPRGIAFDSLTNIIYVSSADIGASSYTVQKFDVDGILLGQWSSPRTVPTYNGYGIAFDSSGNVLVANTFSHRIEKFTTGGTLITQWGTRGSADGQFDSPHDIAIDSSNNVYVSDTYNHRIQVFVLDP
jgi:tripartite motif-containing protein 71